MSTRTKIKAEPVEHERPLHLKYRPQSWKAVVGQDHVTKSLAKALESKARPHSFLFTGPSGCGKTTLSRIVADAIDCDAANIIEVDAATNNGIEAMRDVTSTLRYQGFGETPNKLIIIDECHALSKAAWQSLLKSIEEPPAHVFFALCTTDPGKVPDTIRTRCLAYDLKPVRFDDLMDLLEFVCKEEDYDSPDKHLQMIARACNGSPRQALVMLATVKDCTDDEEVATLLEQPLEDKEVIDLCRSLLKGDLDFLKAVKILKAMEAPNPESIRIVIVNYLAACLLGAKSEKDAARMYDVMVPFLKPFNASDKMAPLLAAFGDLLL